MSDSASTPSNELHDYVSGLRVQPTAEEVGATQPFSRTLVLDYNYPKSHITTRPQHRVKSSPSDNSRSYPIDIAIFSDARKRESDLFIIVEAKRPDRRDGEDQLRDYMRFSTATLGVWTNGSERTFWHKKQSPLGIEFVQIPSLPRYGESLESIGKYRKRDLVVPDDLRAIFRAMRSHLAANVVGTSRDEVLAVQLINLVFCKIYDERFTDPDGLLDFRFEAGEDAQAVRDRISLLFEKVKAKYSGVFDTDDSISLDAASLAYAVGELQGYNLLDSSREAVGEAFETFVGATLKGSQGQFFTPRNVVATIVELIQPKRDELVLDPACGAGGFLIESLRNKWAQIDQLGAQLGWTESALSEERASEAMKTIYGIEKDELLGKVAKAYMAIMGDGKGGIYFADSLDRPDSWPSSMRSHVSLGKFDVVLANPPFGKDIHVTGLDKLGQYELAYPWSESKRNGQWTKSAKLKKRQNPQTLFIERCLQFVRIGGRLGIILPESFFHAPNAKYVRNFLSKHNIVALFDLPHNTFRPYNNAKCVALIIEKGRPQQEKILMAVAEEMGHDHLGRPLFRWDSESDRSTDELWDDTKTIRAELAAAEKDDSVLRRLTFYVDASTVMERDIYIPRYYWPEANVHERLANDDSTELRSIRSLINEGVLLSSAGHGSPEAKYKGRGHIPYIRVKDVINWELYKDPTSRIPGHVFVKLTGSKQLKTQDVIMVNRGSYRIGDSAMVGPQDVEVALTRELQIFRSLSAELDPYYLLYLFNHRDVQAQIKTKVFIDTTLPTLGDRWRELELPFHTEPAVRREIASAVRNALEGRWASMSQIEALRVNLGGVVPSDVIFELDSQLEAESTETL